jgi:hypothetical protein
MKVVVSNTTPLIGTAIIGRFDILRALFGQITIPKAVYNEIVAGINKPGADETHQAVENGWIKIATVPPDNTLNTLKIDLDEGEAEAISLALHQNAALLLIDERKARAKAIGLGIRITGTIGVLLLARKANLLPNIKNEIDFLRSHGFRISNSLYTKILQTL